MEPISVDSTALLMGSAAASQVEEDDVLVVPISTTKYLIKRFVDSLEGSIGSL